MNKQVNKHDVQGVTCWSVCYRNQVFLIGKKRAWLLDRSLLRLLIVWFPRVKGQIAAARSWSVDFSSSEVTLILWSAPQKGFDHLIQFWSLSQVLLHETYKWPLLTVSKKEGLRMRLWMYYPLQQILTSYEPQSNFWSLTHSIWGMQSLAFLPNINRWWIYTSYIGK